MRELPLCVTAVSRSIADSGVKQSHTFFGGTIAIADFGVMDI